MFDRLAEILQKKVNGFEVPNEFRFSDINNLLIGEFEAGLCTALIGQLIFSLFFGASQQKPQSVISGRDYFISQTNAVIDQISQFYDDENDVSMLNMTVVSSMIEQIGGFIVGNLLKDSPS